MDVELAEALNGYSISFAYHSGKIENGRVTYHDVREIFDTKGSLVARYIYDTWGNTLSVTDASSKAITDAKYSLQGTTQSRYLTGGVPPVRFSM